MSKNIINGYEIVAPWECCGNGRYSFAKKNGEIVKKDGLRQNITFYVPQGDNNAIVEYELLKAIYPLLQQVASKF